MKEDYTDKAEALRSSRKDVIQICAYIFEKSNGFYKRCIRFRKNFSSLNVHCVKSVRIRSYSGMYFPAFETEYGEIRVSLRIQFECGETRSRITPNTDTFYVLIFS